MENQAEHKDEDGADSMDRISALPQPLLHHILSLLSQKDAVGTCVLSKSWRNLWYGRPILDFCESCSAHIFPDKRCLCKNCFKGNKEVFLLVVAETLQRYHAQKLSIHEFRLDLWSVDSRSISLLKKLIPMLIKPNFKKNLKTFHLSLPFLNSKYFVLPLRLFRAEFLQELYLKGCKLSQISSTVDKELLLKSLKKLTLSHVHITKEILETILSNSPVLENVSLYLCKGFKTIKLTKPHGLKSFVINDMTTDIWKRRDDDLVRVEIDIPTIESIRVIECLFDHHHYLPHLTFLVLNGAKLSTSSTMFLSAKYLPRLQQLTLESCILPREFHLRLSGSVKRLYFINIMKSINASIDAPNIVQFVYESEISQSTISFATTSSKWTSDITVNAYTDLDNDASLWFQKLSQLLEAFSQSEISLVLNQRNRERNDQRRIEIDDPSSLLRLVPEVVPLGRHKERHEPVVEVQHLNLKGDFSCSSLPDYLNCLFRICRPRYIDQNLYFGDDETYVWQKEVMKLTEFLMDMFLLMERDMRRYFWPQDLEEVSIVEAFDKRAQIFHGVKVRFQMEWRELNLF